MSDPLSLGVLDLPELQCRRALTVNPRLPFHAVVGTRNSGKTEAIRTFVLALATAPQEHEFEVVMLCEERAEYEALSHLPLVTAVGEIADSERVERFVNFAVEHSPAEERRRHRILIIDSWNAFAQRDDAERNGALVDRIGAVLSDSARARVSIVTTVDRPGLIPYRMMSSCAQPIVLRLDDHDDYRLLNINPSDAPTGSIPGRCLFGAHHAQLALVTEIPLNARQPAALDTDLPRSTPVRLLALPHAISRRALLPCSGAFGVAVRTFEPVSLPLGHSVLITGPPLSGKSTALSAFAHAQVRGDSIDVLVAPRTTPTLDSRKWSGYAIGDQPVLALLRELCDALESGTPVRPIRVFVDDLSDFLDPQVDEILERLMQRSTRGDVSLIAAADGARFRQTFGGCASKLRAGRTALLLMPDPDDGDAVGASLPRRVLARPRPGYGMLIQHAAMSEVLIFSA